MDDPTTEDANLALETPPDDVFIPPSINTPALVAGDSYTHFSPVPSSLLSPSPVPCVLGVDEAGRGPVLGPMVYGVFYLPVPLSTPLLRDAHHFDDSKVLTPAVRSSLMEALCTPSLTQSAVSLNQSCGWAVSALSARDIAAGMMRPAHAAPYNLNAQAMDATVDLIRGVIARGVNVTEIYVDTVGPPAAYQTKLARLFPTAQVTVAKKADSLYPCVSAASVCAKVTRDASLEVLYRGVLDEMEAERAAAGAGAEDDEGETTPGWGSGYPSDARCVAWLRRNMHPLFGWGPECRFSWGTVKDMLEAAKAGGTAAVKVEWPVDDDGETSRVTDFFVQNSGGGGGKEKEPDELGTWFGTPTDAEAF